LIAQNLMLAHHWGLKTIYYSLINKTGAKGEASTAETPLAQDLEVWATTIYITPNDDRELWGDNGFVNISGELIYYNGVLKQYGTGRIYALIDCIRNVGPSYNDQKPLVSIKLLQNFDFKNGDKKIYVQQDAFKMQSFPLTGTITLSEPCSDPSCRSVTFHYGNIDYKNFYFSDLTPLTNTDTVAKHAGSASVYLNGTGITNLTFDLSKKPRFYPAGTMARGFVVAEHHNKHAEAIGNVERFIGIDNREDKKSLDWLINYMKSVNLVGDDSFCPQIVFYFTKISFHF
jgi:hypothetical protein